MTKVLRVNPLNPSPEAIREAAEAITGGGTVAFPTETVYGLGANAFDAEAVKRVFKIKGRPSDNPVIVHISKLEQLKDVAAPVSEELMAKFKVLWPGPITFVLKGNGELPAEVTAGLDTVTVRMPAHTVALRLIDAAKIPIAAPSANISGRPSATSAEHVIEDLDGKADVILDGGNTIFGLESTIMDLTGERPRLLRPGAYTVEELKRYFPDMDTSEIIISEGETPPSPGLKYRHYAPDKTLVVAKDERVILDAAKELSGKRILFLCSSETAHAMPDGAMVVDLGSRADLYRIAQNLFDSIRRIDKSDADIAVIEQFPERGIGLALMNRIKKAANMKFASSADEIAALLK
ncbi:MAG TPA: L-threonylcarbamoyladenylate synthase [Candidatus Baltobacteraceae bacterium]|nr:L-threonylcarbamoyladenylate synthase [Candidatus Baltobacteraceae bacterium]